MQIQQKGINAMKKKNKHNTNGAKLSNPSKKKNSETNIGSMTSGNLSSSSDRDSDDDIPIKELNKTPKQNAKKRPRRETSQRSSASILTKTTSPRQKEGR